jgi:ribosomal protein L37AE/L43A
MEEVIELKNWADMTPGERLSAYKGYFRQRFEKRWLREQRKLDPSIRRMFSLSCPECRGGLIYSLREDDIFKCKKCGCEFKTHEPGTSWVEFKGR